MLGPESSIAVGWQKKDEKMNAAGELKVHRFAVFVIMGINLDFSKLSG